MNEMSLSRLYRRLMADRVRDTVSVDDLVDVASSASPVEVDTGRRDRVAAALAQSPQQSDLVRFLRALQPISESLADDVRDARRCAHPTRVREQRFAAGARRVHRGQPLRWVGGIAACLSIALGVWSWHHEDTSMHASLAAHSAPLRDHIFTSNDVIFAPSSDAPRQAPAQGGHGDELFRGHFSG